MNKNQQKISQKVLLSVMGLVVVFGITSKAFASPITPQNLEYLVNKERMYNGLKPLVVDSQLDSAATSKSKDMVTRNYFEHYAFGLTPWDFILSSGYNYLYAGENLAMNFDTSEGTVQAWMNSPAHRANILNPDYEDMGIGVVKGAYTVNGSEEQTVMVTNMFGRKKPAILEVLTSLIDQISEVLHFGK
ncbi:MAG: CAP domain-containing protein [Candidatus Berkelbacteria bacterium]|nr:CAP domain-containing protein [Candidatus Berkelbacteria bacterium]